MPEQHLATYLNDHLAGSVVALELLSYLQEMEQGKPQERFFTGLHAEIEQDRLQLQALMKALNIDESTTRKATAWLTEKLTQFKLRLDDPSGGSLRLLEGLEAVSLGIEGKRGLWEGLAAAAENSPPLRVLDYPLLKARAEDQRRRVEAVRVETARVALFVSEPAAEHA